MADIHTESSFSLKCVHLQDKRISGAHKSNTSQANSRYILTNGCHLNV